MKPSGWIFLRRLVTASASTGRQAGARTSSRLASSGSSGGSGGEVTGALLTSRHAEKERARGQDARAPFRVPLVAAGRNYGAWRLAGMHGGRSAREAVVPEVEHENRPQLGASIALAAAMLIPHHPNHRRVEQIMSPVRVEHVLGNQRPQLRTQPRTDGHRKPHLLALRNARRQQAGDGLFEHDLGTGAV